MEKLSNDTKDGKKKCKNSKAAKMHSLFILDHTNNFGGAAYVVSLGETSFFLFFLFFFTSTKARKQCY